MSTAAWQWQFNSDRQRLQLKMDEVVLDIVYKRRQLQQHLPAVEDFSIDDARLFNELRDYLESFSPLNVNQQLQAALHGTAAIHFGKPSLPQSWHFCFGEIEYWPQAHRACCLDSGLERGEFLVIDQNERSTLCLLLDESLRLSPTKNMQRFDTICVVNDRLQESERHPFPPQQSQHYHSLA